MADMSDQAIEASPITTTTTTWDRRASSAGEANLTYCS